MRLFDAHCHLISDSGDATASPYSPGPVVEKVMTRATAAGVQRVVCCGTSPSDWEQVLRLPEQFPQVFPMIGLHPWFVSNDWKEKFQTLGKIVRGFSVAGENQRAPAQRVGVGETGLDFQDRFTNRPEQEASFAAHLDLARELNCPVAVHCVRAWGPLLEILRDHPAPRVLLHAFGGATELIPEFVKLNCWFSFCGSVTNPKAGRVRAAVQAVPAARLLIETDSPDFPPAGCSFPNEPANLVHVARAVAALRGMSFDTLTELTLNNANSLFNTI